MSSPPPRRVLFVVYDGFELLDMAGPASVFTSANVLAGRKLYDVLTVAPCSSAVSNGGVAVTATPIAQVRITARDTVLVMGAYAAPLGLAMLDSALAALLAQAERRAERYGSVCTGAFVLAAGGFLDGKRATTHWAGCAQFRRRFGAVRLEPDALYVEDGRLWTSAGVTTGVDMALAMVAKDHGPALMGEVAKYLVVYAHRPGHQSQFSGVVGAQTAGAGEFHGLVAWMGEHLAQPIAIRDMAAQVGMSERTFLRKFTAAVGASPSKCLESLRLDRARLALEAGEPVKQVAARVGFRSEAAFRALFAARTGVTPSHYARMHGRG